MNDFNKLEFLAKQYKIEYPPGTRIQLMMMGDDPRPIESGTRATVDHVDDLGTIHCTFDNGRRLGIIPKEDRFRKLTSSELLEERSSLEDQIKLAETDNSEKSKLEKPSMNIQER